MDISQRLWDFCSLLPSKSGEWKEHAVPGASLDGGNNFFRKVSRLYCLSDHHNFKIVDMAESLGYFMSWNLGFRCNLFDYGYLGGSEVGGS